MFLGGGAGDVFQITASSIIRVFNVAFPNTTWNTSTSLPTDFGPGPFAGPEAFRFVVRTNGVIDEYNITPFTATVSVAP